MFKIENYITPIILNYLAKYVKNIRPQDFQMSLWEGEVTFQNLDLRLDVLEKELDVPFDLKSGHIHELSIQVPWTKITSEPIRISINTIEFILEYKESRKSCSSEAVKNAPQHSNESVANNRESPSGSIKRDEEYSHMGSGITMKIVNNINVRCENIIFKYVEEDIVLSMNIQLLNISPANKKWEPDVEDINVYKVVSRKLITISDLTVCLDKRSASGQIDVCHEPVIYRCSLECRVLRTYNAVTQALSSTQRIGLFTNSLDLNLSSMQLPMLMRLIRTIVTVAGGENNVCEIADLFDNQLDNGQVMTPANENISFFSWIGSYLTSFYAYNSEEDDINNAPGHIKDFGFYIKELAFTLKNSELTTDALVGGVKRVRYTPIIKFTFGGLYIENVAVKEINWSNFKMGLSSIYVESLSNNSTDRGRNCAVIMETEPFTNNHSFVDKSLFDEQCKIPDKGWIVTNYEDYRTRITDEYLLYRSPIFAFDKVEHSTSERQSHREEEPSASIASSARSNVCLRKHIRVIGTGVVIRYNETLVQVKNVFKDFIESYDYTAYSNAEKPETDAADEHMSKFPLVMYNAGSDYGVAKDDNAMKNTSAFKLHPPHVEDYDQLMLGIPLCTYKINIKSIKLEIYPQSQIQDDNIQHLLSSNQAKSYCVKKNCLPHLIALLDHAEGTLSMPINPDKLVHTTCQLPDKPEQLLQACYKNLNFTLNNVTINIVTPHHQHQQSTHSSYHMSKIINIPKITIDFGKLLEPMYWKKDEVATGFLDVYCDNVKVEFSINQLVMVLILIQAIMKYRPDLLIIVNHKIRQTRTLKSSSKKIQGVLTKLNMKRRQYHTFELWNITLGSLHADLIFNKNVCGVAQRFNIFNTTSRLHNNQNKWLEFQLQLPLNTLHQENEDEQLVLAFGLWMEKYNLIVDKYLADFLTIKDSITAISEELSVFTSSIQLNTANAEQQPQDSSILKVVTPVPVARPSSSSSVLNTKHSLPQVFGRSVSVGNIRKPSLHSQHGGSGHSISERDEKVHIVATEKSKNKIKSSIVSNTANDTSITNKFQRYYSMIIMVEIAQGHVHLAKSADRNDAGDFQGDFIHIFLPHILWKSTFAEYITRSTIHFKANPPPIEPEKFNWTIQLHDFYIMSYQHNQRNIVSNPWHTTLTVAMTQRLQSPNELQKEQTFHIRSPKLFSESSIYSINLHIDSGIMHIYINHCKCLVNQLEYISQIFQLIQLMYEEVTACKTSKLNSADSKNKNKLIILTNTEENIHLKEFMELDTSSNTSSYIHLHVSKVTNTTDIAIFCQWTITKIVTELYAERTQNNKIVVELEDLLFTLDSREEFTKYTNKIGNFQLHYYEIDNNQSWVAHDYISIRKVINTTDHPFFNIIYTTASLRDYYKRSGLKRKQMLLTSISSPPRNTISEIDVNIQAIEIIVNLEYTSQFVQPLCKLFCGVYDNPKNSVHNDKFYSSDYNVITSNNLPLMHFNSKGITMYLPVGNSIEPGSVLILKIESIKMSSTLTNPLQRNPLRPQVFAKATSMGILTLPGSLIEDRQYELTIQHISATTGNWNNILSHIRSKVKIGNANPAVEWNNAERKPDLIYNEVFKDFTFVVIYAPNIVYNNILICGAALEFNCASDFVASINTDQLTMFAWHVRCIQKILEHAELSSSDYTSSTPLHAISCSDSTLYKSPNCSTCSSERSVNISTKLMGNFHIKRTVQPFQAISKSSEEKSAIFNTDSGINSNSLESQKRGIPIKGSFADSLLSSESDRCNSGMILKDSSYNHVPNNIQDHHVPYTISLVAGVFIIKILHSLERAFKAKKYATQPLLSCTISQPSFMFTQNVFDSSMHFSIFNIGLYLPDLERKTTKNVEITSLFPISLIDTKIGEPKSNGIPPALFNYKLTSTKQQRREIDIDFGRTTILNLNEDSISQLCTNLLIICSSIEKYAHFNIHGDIPIVRKNSKIQLIKQKTLNADTLNVTIKTFTIKFFNPNEYDCDMALCDILLHMKYLNKPEKCSFRLNIGAIYLRTMQKMFLHPLSLKLTLDIVNESWLRLPLLSCIIKFNVVHIDIGINSILQIRKCMYVSQSIVKHLNKEWQHFWYGFLRHGLTTHIEEEKVNLIKCCPSETFVKSTKYIQDDEYYQDDLRAGAFQFVELTTDILLPLPYQIQIIKKDYGIICWRYPQPRKMVKILIHPIPMMSKAPACIKCSVEYFSEVQEQFVHYCNFWLSETLSTNIELPERPVCAYIWRVVILQPTVSVNRSCFDDGIEDDELLSINSSRMSDILNNLTEQDHVVIHPKALVGCMRIDTIFQIKNVPKMQFMLKCNEIRLNLINEPHSNVTLPPLLKKFTVSKMVTTQTFIIIGLKNVNIHGCFFNKNKYSVDTNFSCNIKCLDYGYLNMLPLVEDISLSCYFELDKMKNIVITNIVCDPLRINFGPAIIHTILVSKNHWEELLDADEYRVNHAVIPKCIIVNNTLGKVAFGQTGTKEYIELNVRECYLYSFCSDIHKQELKFFITDENINEVISSPSVYIPLKLDQEYTIRNVRVGDKCLTIKFRKLSNYQIYVSIKGQIQFVSMVPHSLSVQFHYAIKNSSTEEKHSSEYLIDKYGKSSVNLPVQMDSNVHFRLKMMEKHSRGYTGEIPMTANKKLPWLVKVPKNSTDFISFWVRVLREDVRELWTDEFQPQKILITIWPIYEILSYLSCPLELKQSENSENIIRVAGEYGKYILDVPATHLTEHDIQFIYRFPVKDKSQTHYNLNLKGIDWQQFFWFDETIWTVEHSLHLLSKLVPRSWPLNDDDEARLQRCATYTTAIDIIYNLNRTREISCTLSLEVVPWGIFVNSSGLNVRITDLKNQQTLSITNNDMAMTFDLSEGFYINIPNGLHWESTYPIFFDNNRLSKLHRIYYILSTTKSCDIVLSFDGNVYSFILNLSIENNRKIIKLISKFNVVNFTKSCLYLLPFVMSCKENVNQNAIYGINRTVSEVKLKAVGSWTTCVGISLPKFYEFPTSTSRNSRNENSYAHFLSIKSSITSAISIPLCIETPFKRRCLSIQNGSGCLALAVTTNEKDGIIYISIAEDTYPALLINNETECSFMIGQTNATDYSTAVPIIPEHDDLYFEWYHKVPQKSESYYTPPAWYINFPETDTVLCNITLALWNDDIPDKKVKWSKPLCINKAYKKYLHVPGHGEVQIIICNKHRVVRLNILYISQQMEFSIKDLRSRLSISHKFTSSEELNTNVRLDVTQDQALNSDQIPSFKICHHFRNDCCNESSIRILLYIKEIVFSLHVDSNEKQCLKQDVFNLYMDDVVIAYDDTKDNDERELNVLIPNLQIDNQLFSTGRFDFPVILCSEKLYEKNSNKPIAYYLNQTCAHIKQNMLMLNIQMSFFTDEYKIHTLSIHLSPARIYIEDGFITDLLEALVECDTTNGAYKGKVEFERRLLEGDQIIMPSDVAATALHLLDPVYVRSFSIEPMQVLLSVHTSLRLYIALDHSPLSFSIYQREHLLTLPLKLGQSLGMHYLSGAIFGAGWVVGSLEILGSPSGLARSVTTGLKDFISLPVQGLFRGPWGFILGITQGSASLFKNISAGTVNSVTKLAASVARNLDRLSLDSEHIERTELLRRSRPQGFTEGIYQGMTGFGISILGAVGGLAHHTLDARTTTEVFAGVGKGLVGAFTKPLSGAAELLALAGQGMLQTVGFNALPQQRSPSSCRNIAVEPSICRLWKILPTQLLSNQILFFNSITLTENEKLRGGFICLTSNLFILIENDWDQLHLACPINKVEIQVDFEDKTLHYVHVKHEKEDGEEVSSYAAERIIIFLQNSNLSGPSDSLADLLYNRPALLDNSSQNPNNYDYAFYINEYYSEYILRYLKILNVQHLKT